MGLPPQTLGGASRCLTRFRLCLQLKQMSAARQKRANIHNARMLCATGGREKACAPLPRIKSIMHNGTCFAGPRVGFKWGSRPKPRVVLRVVLNRSASASAPCGVRCSLTLFESLRFRSTPCWLLRRLFDVRPLPRPPKNPPWFFSTLLVFHAFVLFS